MLDSRTISFNALSLINAEDIVGVHKIDPEVDAAVNITQNLKYLEAAYNEAFESGATLEELEELEVDRQLQKMKDGTQSISGGCIVLTSRTGNLEIPRTSQGDTAFLLGFNRYKSFYSPKYVTGEERKSLVPDNRTTIYWQPQLLFQVLILEIQLQLGFIRLFLGKCFQSDHLCDGLRTSACTTPMHPLWKAWLKSCITVRSRG